MAEDWFNYRGPKDNTDLWGFLLRGGISGEKEAIIHLIWDHWKVNEGTVRVRVKVGIHPPRGLRSSQVGEYTVHFGYMGGNVYVELPK